MPIPPGAARRRVLRGTAFLGVILAAGLLAGYLARRHFVGRVEEGRALWLARLDETAEERAAHVTGWIGDGLNDARVLASFPTVSAVLTRAASPDVPAETTARPASMGASERDHLVGILDSFVAVQGYRAAYVTDPRGRIVAATDDPFAAALSPEVLARGLGAAPRPVTMLRLNGTVFAVIVVPVASVAADRHPAGFVSLVGEPALRLYPELLRQPVPTLTGENLLVDEEGGRAVSLSPLRHRAPGPASGDFVAMPDRLIAAGTTGSREEADYRGVSVLVAARAIPGTPWILLSKVDRDEALGPYERRALEGLAGQAAAIVAIAAIMLGAWWRRQASYAADALTASDRIGFLNRLLRTILEVDRLIVRERDRQRLLGETCRIIVDAAGFVMAWTGEVDASGWVRPVAWAGRVDGYLDNIEIRADDSAHGQGPTGTAITERRTVLMEDIAAAPGFLPWRTRALDRGYRCSAAFPLLVGDRVFGAINVYGPRVGMLHAEAVQLLEELASNLGHALQVIERESTHQATERALAEAEDRFRQSQKMEAMGRLAGGVAHDFNNLLTAISGYAELALAEASESERHHLQEISAAAARAAALTRQLLVFSRKQVVQLKVLDLNEVVRDIEKLLRRLIGENIELATWLSPELWSIKADAGQLDQVLVNLAVNARDAMPTGGRLLIQTRNEELTAGDARLRDLPPGRYVSLSVTDTGVGMTREVQERLFEPFFTTKEAGKGTGLGLSTVYGIVKQFGGAIAVESEPGGGSTFRIVFPGSDLPAEAAEPLEGHLGSARSARLPGGESVLVVEDNEGVRGFVCEALRRAGYRTIESDSGERALDLLLALDGEVDLLLTDVVLPQMDGRELARRAGVGRPSLPVLFMSGYADSPLLRYDARDDGVDLIEKPFTAAAIVERVRQALCGGPAQSAT